MHGFLSRVYSRLAPSVLQIHRDHDQDDVATEDVVMKMMMKVFFSGCKKPIRKAIGGFFFGFAKANAP